MSYKTKTIQEVIAEIDGNKVYLPALQRKFVWGKHQIQLLFDSLMRNYPIGTFLFWKLDKQTANNYVFYEFLKEYDQRAPYNRRKTGAFLHEEITGVLDGQQRLSSMVIGLMGTHAEKARYRRVSDDAAYQKMSLYLNLLSLPFIINEQGDIEMQEERNFEFRFLTEDDASSGMPRKVKSYFDDETSEERMEQVCWLKVGDVLSWKQDIEADQLIEQKADGCSSSQKEAISDNKRVIRYAINMLHSRICKEPLLNYFEIAKSDLEDILKIFIRVNSGGTTLSKTDLLFSTIVATWDDGREQIEDLLKLINNKGDKFIFSNEYLMRCCLMLTDAPTVYKVNSFKSENVQKIRNEWPKISQAISKTVDLLVEFGFNGSLLTSQNSTIIIAYYIYKGGDLGEESKENIRKYLIHALLNRIYSSSQDQLLGALRNIFRTKVEDGKGASYKLSISEFSFDHLLKVGLPGRKSLAVTEADIDLFLASKKGSVSFFVLSLLYPQLRFQDQSFHQDHIHPYSRFNEETFLTLNLSKEEQELWLECRDCVPNLQLLNGRENVTKNATPLIDWSREWNESKLKAFKQDHYFPEDVGFEFSSFLTFFEKRKGILRLELHKVLAVSNELPVPPSEDWESAEELEEGELVSIHEGAV